MSVLGTSNLTLFDLQRQLDPDGSVAKLVNIVSNSNPILEDIPWMQGNRETGNQVSQVTEIEEAGLRAINGYTTPTKSGNKVIVDGAALIESWGEVDSELLRISPNPEQTRMNADKMKIEAMGKKVANLIFYGDTTSDQLEINGLQSRYDTPGTTRDTAGYQLIDAGGDDSDNASIYIVGWGDDRVYGFYPKNTQAGLEFKDLGEETAEDGSGGLRRVVRSQYIWRCGLSVADPRYVVRICNIKTGSLAADLTTGADLVDGILAGLELLPSLDNITPVIYCSRTIRSFFRRQMNKTDNAYLTWDNIGGKRIMRFAEAKVSTCDALLDTESSVTGTFAHTL